MAQPVDGKARRSRSVTAMPNAGLQVYLALPPAWPRGYLRAPQPKWFWRASHPLLYARAFYLPPGPVTMIVPSRALHGLACRPAITRHHGHSQLTIGPIISLTTLASPSFPVNK